ncbi:YaiO family outer membrane beta-barrel protein [Metallibacterium sp.]|jgi:YaiO family outer membrane protein|uniref:YaiO family outer membrane beta-barrel protein n=1 Tax=Metallibacterium sp. TaxID=2940281 RepID=UPI002635C8B4|nr:YaiO family outer membrane beta-barrel protein [Metallibacterium sp.]
MSAKCIKTIAVASVLLALGASLQVHAGTHDYAAAIRRVNQDLKAGRRVEAQTKLEQLRKTHPTNPEVAALLLQTQCGLHEFSQARALMRQVGAQAKYAELAQAINRCRLERTFADAEALLKRGDAAGAVRLVSPLYPQGSDPYHAGMILMRAYIAEHQTAKAATIAAALAARYPSDKGLAISALQLQTQLVLNEAQRALDTGQAATAIRLADLAYRHGLDLYRAGVILTRAYIVEHQTAKAATIAAALAARYPADKGLATSALQLQTQQVLDEAQHALKTGHPVTAIRMADPVYLHGPDVYRAGLILARAYSATHQTELTAAIYADLAQRYPKDAQLNTQATQIKGQLILVEAEHRLNAGDAAGAIVLATPLYSDGPDPYRAGLILAHAYEAEHQPAKAIALYTSLAKRYPLDKGLIVQADHLRAAQTLSEARRQLASGHAAKAIQLASTMYPDGPDPYDAGLVLAHAYTAQRNAAAAATIYAALAKRYPADKGLAVASVVNNVQAGRATTAQSELQQMDAAQQSEVFSSLGQGINRLYGNFVTLDGSAASSTRPPTGDDLLGIQAGTTTSIGTFVASAQQIHRFAQGADMYGLDYYTGWGAGYSAEVSFEHSPNNTILARNSIGLALSRSLGSFSLDASVRHLVYSNTEANVLFGGVGLHPSANVRVETGLYYVPETNAYSVLVAPEWFHGGQNRTYLYVTVGQTGEQLAVRNAILRTPSQNVTLGETFQLTNKTYLSAEVFYEHRSGLYSRRGIYLTLTRRW